MNAAVRIAMKELLAFRDVKILIYMLATPIVFMLILGAALSDAFRATVSVDDIRVLYQFESGMDALHAEWDAFVHEAGRSGIRFEPAAAGLDGEEEVRSGRYGGVVTIADSGLAYSGNSAAPVENSVVTGMLETFADNQRLASVLPGGGATADAAVSGGYLSETWMEAAKQPGALDYYSIAMTTMIVLYMAMSAGLLMDAERKGHTAIRLLAAPIGKSSIFAGKLAGAFLLNALSVLIIVLVSKYMFRAEWGDHLGAVFAVLLSQIVFSLGLGLCIGYLIRGSASFSVLVAFVQVSCFFGGAYFPVKDLTGALGVVRDLTPLTWTNDALLDIIFADRLSAAVPTILINAGSAVFMLAAAVILMRRREGL